MTNQELEQVIRDQLMDIYNAEYIGKIKITKLNPTGYQIQLGMNTPECPDVIYAELEDNKFLEYLRNELQHRRFNTVFYGKLFKTMPPECNTINKACSCNDRR